MAFRVSNEVDPQPPHWHGAAPHFAHHGTPASAHTWARSIRTCSQTTHSDTARPTPNLRVLLPLSKKVVTHLVTSKGLGTATSYPLQRQLKPSRLVEEGNTFGHCEVVCWCCSLSSVAVVVLVGGSEVPVCDGGCRVPYCRSWKR